MTTAVLNSTPPLIIATRESRLAWWQAQHVCQLLEKKGISSSLLGMTTVGDQILDQSLSKIGGKGLFVKELETALLDGRADLAVHSLKDVPMNLPKGLVLGAILPREDARDAFVSTRYSAWAELPRGACVGTSSLRRAALLRAMRPDLRIEPLRGNLDTRLGKLDSGHFDAIVLAAAGLQRLGLSDRIREIFTTKLTLPSPGQGALGLEIRANDLELCESLTSLNHFSTALAVTAERAVSRTLGGSCSIPLAAHAYFEGDELKLGVALGHSSDISKPLLSAHVDAKVENLAQAESLGIKAASLLQELGARTYLEQVKH